VNACPADPLTQALAELLLAIVRKRAESNKQAQGKTASPPLPPPKTT
jgi:hypothetical protein